MTEIKIYNKKARPQKNIEEETISFLFEHLENFGDPKDQIEAALKYALGENGKPGGTIITAYDSSKSKIIGAVIMNETGMQGYIPENILVYIATHKDYRGKGIGKKLMNAAIEHSTGNIALHCEPDNPAKKLYEKLGFTSKYLEMRLTK